MKNQIMKIKAKSKDIKKNPIKGQWHLNLSCVLSRSVLFVCHCRNFWGQKVVALEPNANQCL